MEAALFSTADLFGEEEEHDKDDASEAALPTSIERIHPFPRMDLLIREFSFHPLNANLLWPGTIIFANWLVEHRDLLIGRHILELGSGTGALSIFLKKILEVDVTTSDFDDEEIEKNIAYNCKLNNVPVLQHIRYTWGDKFPLEAPYWDLILANDILLYVKQYSNLVKSISFLLKNFTPREDAFSFNGEGEGFASYLTSNSISNELCQNKPSTTIVEDGDNLSHMSSNAFEESSKELDKSKVTLLFSKSNLDTRSEIPKPCLLMSWRRRIPKEDESLFFDECRLMGLFVEHLGSKIYCIGLCM